MNRLSEEYLDRFAEAVVQVIWDEMGHQRVRSLRELARRAGMTHTAVITRMNGDTRTGKRAAINVRDLASFGNALGLAPAEILRRARLAAGPVTRDGDPVSEGSPSLDDLRAAHEEEGSISGEQESPTEP